MSDIYGILAQIETALSPLKNIPSPQKTAHAESNFVKNYKSLLSATKSLIEDKENTVWPPEVEQAAYVEIESYLNQLIAIIQNSDDYEPGAGIVMG